MSKYFAIYDANGKVLKTTYRNHVNDMVFSGGVAVEEITAEISQRIQNGRVYRTAGVYYDVPPAPSEHHEFNYVSKTWEDPRTLATKKLDVVAWIRKVRRPLLNDCDWTQLPDAPLTPTKVSDWQDYRQELRDMPTVYADEDDRDAVVWPTPPA